MDLKQVSAELVRAVRGTKSQTALSRKLGYRGNQLYRWESGERNILWPDFVRLCSTCHVDLRGTFRKFYLPKDPSRADLLASALIGEAKLLDVSKVTGISHYSLVRWRKGKATPPLSEILSLLHHCQFILLEFLDTLVGADQLLSANRAFRERSSQKKIFYKHPIASAILCYFKLEEYRSLKRHRDGVIAAKFDLTHAEEKEILNSLEALQIIKVREDKYEVLTEDFDLKASKDEMRVARRYWLNRATEFNERAAGAAENTGFGVNVHAASEGAVEQLRQEALSFFLKARAILQSDRQKKNQIFVVNLQMYDFFEAQRLLEPHEGAST